MKRCRLLIIAMLLLCISSAYAGKVEEAAALYGGGKYDEAIALLKDVLEADPTNATAYLFLASGHEKKEQWSDAADGWSKFVKLSKDDGQRTFGEKRPCLIARRTACW